MRYSERSNTSILMQDNNKEEEEEAKHPTNIVVPCPFSCRAGGKISSCKGTQKNDLVWCVGMKGRRTYHFSSVTIHTCVSSKWGAIARFLQKENEK
jgi:hypothetical protein